MEAGFAGLDFSLRAFNMPLKRGPPRETSSRWSWASGEALSSGGGEVRSFSTSAASCCLAAGSAAVCHLARSEPPGMTAPVEAPDSGSV